MSLPIQLGALFQVSSAATDETVEATDDVRERERRGLLQVVAVGVLLMLVCQIVACSPSLSDFPPPHSSHVVAVVVFSSSGFRFSKNCDSSVTTLERSHSST